MKSLPFFKGLSWLIILNLLVKPVWIFFIDRKVQNIVGFETYGKYFAAFNLTFVLLFLADAGLTNMLNQRIAGKASISIHQLFRIKILLLLVYAITCYTVAWLTHISQWDLLLYLVIVQALTSLFVFLRSIVTAHQFFIADAFFSVLDKLLMILLCGGFVYGIFGNINLIIFLQMQMICTSIAVAAVLIFILQKKLLLPADKEKNRSIAKWIAPFAIIILLMSVHYRLDGFLLERIHVHGAYEAGIYASAYRLLDAGNMLGYLAASFLVPFMARNQFDKAIIEKTVINLRHVLIFFAIGIISFIIVFASWIQVLLYHTDVSYNTRILQLCIGVLPAYYFVHIYGSALTATANFRAFISVLFTGVAINIVLNLFLIPTYGALGCCISALISQYFCGITLYIVASKRLQISFGARFNLIYIIAAIGLFSFFYFGKMAVNNVWIILAIAVVAVSVLLLKLNFIKNIFSPVN